MTQNAIAVNMILYDFDVLRNFLTAKKIDNTEHPTPIS